MIKIESCGIGHLHDQRFFIMQWIKLLTSELHYTEYEILSLEVCYNLKAPWKSILHVDLKFL